jgi:hypothetical protein
MCTIRRIIRQQYIPTKLPVSLDAVSHHIIYYQQNTTLPRTARAEANFSSLLKTTGATSLASHSKGSCGRLTSSSPTSWTTPAHQPQARHDNNIKGEDPVVTVQQGRTLATRTSSGNEDALRQQGHPLATRTLTQTWSVRWCKENLDKSEGFARKRPCLP